MRKLRPIGTLPPVLQFVILFCLLLGFVGSLNALLGNLVHLAFLPLIALGFGIWHWSDKAAERKEGAKKASVVARAKVGSPSMEAAPAVSGPTVADYEGALKDLQAMMAAETDEAKRAKLSAAVEQVETQLAEARMAAAAETKVTEADDASMRELIAAFERVVAAKAEGLENATGSSLAPRATLPTPNVIGAPDFCPNLLTGQLVARYKKTHDEDYQAEYERRLRSLGFTEQEANAMFVFELMILKHDAIERLAGPDYLASAYFDLQHPLLTQDESWYVEHQRFLCSEITKIWDEAEWHYWNSHERENLPNDVWGEIYRISRYGGGKLLVDYLTMLSEKSSINMAKIQAYSAAEQQLVFAYKWNRGKRERHPYPVGQGTATAGDASQKPATASASQATSTVSQSKKGATAAATPMPASAAPKPAKTTPKPNAQTTSDAAQAKGDGKKANSASQESPAVPTGTYSVRYENSGFVEESVSVRIDPLHDRYVEITERETWNSHGTDSHETRTERMLTVDQAIAALMPSHYDVAKRLERYERDRTASSTQEAAPAPQPATERAAKPSPAPAPQPSPVLTPKKTTPAAKDESSLKAAQPTKSKPAQTAKAQKVKLRAVNSFFADPEDVSVDGYCVYSSGNTGYETEDVTVRADPFRHRYSEITEREVWNSHGTDSHESRYERSLTADEAVAALAPKHADVAERLERFEQSCARANEACVDLLRKRYPGWTVEEVLYNSYNCTLLRVRDDKGSQCALKMSRGGKEDVQRLRDFCQALERMGGCAHIVGLEDICRLPVGKGARVMLERMPLLRPAYDVSGGPVSSRSYANVASMDGRDRYNYRVALDVARALAKMHELGYVHMDVRPENILVDEEGRFVLADLASVRKVSEQYEGTLQTSTEFRAPEIARHEPFGTDADVFAWGRSMLFAMMGKPKRAERSETRVYTVERGRFNRLTLRRDGTFVGGCNYCDVEGLPEVALKACSQDRGERYRDGTELVAALESIA